MLTHEEQRELLKAAREAITCAVRHAPPGRPPRPLPGLRQACGLFVTIRRASRLRGCIGHYESRVPLLELAPHIAVKSALDDPRFPPLGAEELGEISLELSILSPLHPVADIQEIVPGTHGLLLELRGARGLLLPQVATEFGMTREEFLCATAQKAGLPQDAWKDPATRLSMFTAEIIQEPEQVHDVPPGSSAL
jgi:AmmeMemoRadiSam system protein A